MYVVVILFHSFLLSVIVISFVFYTSMSHFNVIVLHILFNSTILFNSFYMSEAAYKTLLILKQLFKKIENNIL